jgi:hypothetical protein
MCDAMSFASTSAAGSTSQIKLPQARKTPISPAHASAENVSTAEPKRAEKPN